MKALLLAAGFGTRLRPLTDHVPKCLVPLAGRPILDYWWPLLRAHGVVDVLINTHYLHDKVMEYVQGLNGDLRVQLTHEPQLLGTAGTLWANRAWLAQEQDFFVIYADHVSRMNLSRLREVQRRTGATLTLALYHAAIPTQCGIVELEGERVVSFVEKPEHPVSDLANAAIYCVSAKIFEALEEMRQNDPFDFGLHVLPALANRGELFGWVGEGCYHQDVGNWETYHKVEQDIREGRVDADTCAAGVSGVRADASVR